MLNLFQHPSCRKPCRMTGSEKQPAIYLLASGAYGTLYIGVTSDLIRRMWQHRSHTLPGFTARYAVHHLVHYEFFADMAGAIMREKQLKKLAPPMEDQSDRRRKPGLARSRGGIGVATPRTALEARWILKQVQDDERRIIAHGGDKAWPFERAGGQARLRVRNALGDLVEAGFGEGQCNVLLYDGDLNLFREIGNG